ncbi:MAG: GAF domain-containing protein, partial [Syntrophomonas sp.]
MNSKQVVFIGLVITSLLSSLVMFELIPGLPMALIVLVAGLMLTYYIALSQKRLDRLAEMNLLLRSNRAIQSKFQEADICGNLKFWAGCLVKSEHIFVWTEGDELNEEIIKAWPEWAALNACIRENQTTIVFNRKDNAPSLRPTPEWIKSYIGIPLKVEGNVVAILYEVNEQEKGFFDDKER